jgi:heme exporter protein D
MDTGNAVALIAVAVSLVSLVVTSALAIWVRSEASKDERERRAEARRLHENNIANESLSEAVRALGRLRIALLPRVSDSPSRDGLLVGLQEFSSCAYYFRALPRQSESARKLFEAQSLASLLMAHLIVSDMLPEWAQNIEYLQTELSESASELHALMIESAFSDSGHPGVQRSGPLPDRILPTLKHISDSVVASRGSASTPATARRGSGETRPSSPERQAD